MALLDLQAKKDGSFYKGQVRMGVWTGKRYSFNTYTDSIVRLTRQDALLDAELLASEIINQNGGEVQYTIGYPKDFEGKRKFAAQV